MKHLLVVGALAYVADLVAEYFCPMAPGVIKAEPVTVTAIALSAAAVAGGVQAYQGQQNLENSRRMRNAQDNLEKQRQKQLADEAAARAAARDRAATAGQRVGRGALITSLGFGSGNTSPGVGSGALFGN